MTYKLLSIVVGEELLQLEAPVVAPLQDAVLQQRLTHVAPPRVQVPSVVGSTGVNQDVQAVHAEAPEGGDEQVSEGRARFVMS